MKMFKVLFSFIVVGFIACGAAFAASLPFGTAASNGGKTSSVSVTAAAGTVGTILSAGARVGGYVINTSTNYLHVSLTGSTTTAIEAGNFLVYPTADSYGRDRIALGQYPMVYQGPMYFTAYDSSGTKGTGSMSAIEFK